MKIKEHIINLIARGVYHPGDKLPSETTFAEELNVSRASLREALRVLEKEGRIIKKQGVGTFVSQEIPRIKKGIEELFSVTDTIKNEGFSPGTNNLNIEKIIPSKSLSLKMNLDQRKEVLQINRVRTADSRAVVFCVDYLNILQIPIKMDEDFSGSLFELLENKHNIVINYALTEIKPVTADKVLADKLEININDPVLLLEQKHFDDQDSLFLYSENYFRSDEFQFKVIRKR